MRGRPILSQTPEKPRKVSTPGYVMAVEQWGPHRLFSGPVSCSGAEEQGARGNRTCEFLIQMVLTYRIPTTLLLTYTFPTTASSDTCGALSVLSGVCGHRPPTRLYRRVLSGLSEEPKVFFPQCYLLTL